MITVTVCFGRPASINMPIITKQIESDYPGPIPPCAVKNCKKSATFESPADLCHPHWLMWWNGEPKDHNACLVCVLAGEFVPAFKPE